MEVSDSSVSYSIPEGLLDLKELQKRVDDVLNADLYWFPVRHHSPTVARLLKQVIQERKPKIIFMASPPIMVPTRVVVIDNTPTSAHVS